MYLIFDTETTGLPKSFKAPIDDFNNWPRLVQLAWQNYSAQGELISSFNYIIKPHGFTISDEVAKIHRIDQARAEREGLDLLPVLEEFKKELLKTEFVVAHNIAFDEKIVGAEFLRNNIPNIFESTRKICTMKSSANICKIPGGNKYKWPNLTELHTYLFQRDFAEAHDAEADVKALAKCFFELKNRGLLF